MVNYYKTVEGRITPLPAAEAGAWIDMIAPTDDEIRHVSAEFGVETDYLRAALDEEETSRIESEDGVTLIIIDTPMAIKEETEVTYSTVPVGIITTDTNIITVSLRENQVIREFAGGFVKNIQTAHKTRFIFQMLLRTSSRYLQYLRQIEKMSSYIERQVHKSIKNKELIQLLGLQKSLVYFNASLKADEVTIEKLLRGRIIKLYDEDQDLLEDVIIEFKQAIEMAAIYADVMASTTEAFAAVISNNLNIIMKVMTSITILLTIPNIVFGFYGMNVPDLPVAYTGFAIAISIIFVSVAAFVLWKKDLL